MLQHPSTLQKTHEAMNLPKNPNVHPIFHKRDFENKEIVLIMAKTWGAARLFFFQTALCKFRNLKVEYLSKKEQITYEMHHMNTVVIALPRALENEKNVELLKLCGSKRFKIINFKTAEV